MKAGVGVLSLFTFSSENWSRPSEEVDFLMQLFMKTIADEMEALHEQGVRVCFMGDRRALVTTLQVGMDAIESLTVENTGLTLNIAINYGGRWDILQAARRLAEAAVAGEITPECINEKLLTETLSTKNLPDPDLLIRTSGELRISNFFLWQLAYSEFYFSTVYWPDFNAEEFQRALESFAMRQRRYGLVEESAYV
jgi:undecaprenyl diphosphate synthase